MCAEPICCARGSSPVAVRASDLAFGQLPLQTQHTAAAAHKPRHVVQLVFDVIELQNEGIVFAAVDTRGIGEELKNERMIASIRGDAKGRCGNVDVRAPETSVVSRSSG